MQKLLQAFIKFFSLPELENEEELQTAKLLNPLLNMLVVFSVIYSIVILFSYGLFSIQFLGLFVLAAAMLIFRSIFVSGMVEMIAPYFLGTTWLVVVLIFLFADNGLRTPSYSAFIIFLTVLAGVLISTKAAFYISAGSISVGVISIILEYYGLSLSIQRVPDIWLALIGQIIFLSGSIFILSVFQKNQEAIKSQYEEKLEKIQQDCRDSLKKVQATAAQNDSLEEALAEANQDLEAFTYSVSHDMRAPLRAIIGFSDILLSDFQSQLPEQGRQFLHRIHTSGTNMNLLLDEMLLLSRTNEAVLNFSNFDLSSLAEEIFIDQLQYTENREIVFRPNPTPMVLADNHQMRIMMTNLISNAVKFTNIRVSALIEFGAEERNGINVFYLRDNGIGFDMKYAGRIFAPFHRLHNTDEYEGTGIGLTLSKRIIKRHGGEIWVESRPNQGTTVFFTLS